MPAAGTTNGPLHAVPCAHCGTPQDLRALDEQKLVENGAGISCDRCNRISEVVGIKNIKLIVMRQQ